LTSCKPVSFSRRTLRRGVSVGITFAVQECNTYNSITIERYTIQWLIFSANVWTPTLQTTSGCKVSINNGTKTQHSRQETNLNRKLTRPLQHNDRNKQRSLPDNTVRNSTGWPRSHRTPRKYAPQTQYKFTMHSAARSTV